MLHKVILIILHLFLYVECELEVILEHRFKKEFNRFRHVPTLKLVIVEYSFLYDFIFVRILANIQNIPNVS